MNQLTIANITIKQDQHGRYCLNDLHKAAGAEKRHQPSNWLQLEQTQELINEINIPGIPGIESKQGVGTFGLKQVIYAYANWISPKFYLHVINTYDALVTGQLPSPQQGNLHLEVKKINEEERMFLINLMYPKKMDMEDREPWAKFNAHFGIKKILDLPVARFAEAIKWINELPCPHVPLLRQSKLITEEQHQAIIRAMTAKDAYSKGYWEHFFQYFKIIMTDDLYETQFDSALLWIWQLPDPVPALTKEDQQALHIQMEKQKFLSRDNQYVALITKELAWRLDYANNPQNKSAIFIETPIWEAENVRKEMRPA